MPPFLLVLLGATGDLARRKLIPALYRLHRRDAAPFLVLGVGRSDWDDARMQAYAREALDEAGEDDDAGDWVEKTFRFAEVEGYDGLDAAFARAEEMEGAVGGNRIYYLATPPSTFEGVIEAIGQREKAAERGGWSRLVVEKPFGRDLESARRLNALVHRHFDEEQVYRIDHYLGKDTVQNLLVFRFANQLFEALWNRQHVARVEITVAETVGVEGRAGYFDRVGTLRDMIQNHLTQLFTLTAMEPPARFDAASIRQEKIKVLRSTAPVDPARVVLGQYGPGADGQEGYRQHQGVPDDSDTETYAAVTLHVENWRWQGVPFVLRTGKRLPERRTEIAVVFHCPPVALFEAQGPCPIAANVLRIRLQPDEGFQLGFEVKKPGEGFALSTQHLDFHYDDVFDRLPDAYETLLLDVARGDQTLFVHAEEAEAAWKLYGPLLDAGLPVRRYRSGTWGPDEGGRLPEDAPVAGAHEAV
ncbi:MAG TPA: glucose-6-phosphate dehydrogenase [Rubricoccaceae bacterium]|nr:glucose-6-phosphate dehydrogenase [Rubricoccaceae bacterium]